jgi:hypothetical protein
MCLVVAMFAWQATLALGGSIDTPLNLYVVINLRARAEAAAATIVRRVRHKYCDWLNHRRRQGHVLPPPAYVFTFENRGSLPRVNLPAVPARISAAAGGL